MCVCRFCSVVLAHQIERIAVQNNRLGGTVFCACVITKDVKERQLRRGEKNQQKSTLQSQSRLLIKKRKKYQNKRKQKKERRKIRITHWYIKFHVSLGENAQYSTVSVRIINSLVFPSNNRAFVLNNVLLSHPSTFFFLTKTS